jgi:hypothetical protein
MSLQATYFGNVINYKVCFQNVSVDEFNTLHNFLVEKFERNSYDMVYSDLQYPYYAAVWLKFYNEQDELRFKLLWSVV